MSILFENLHFTYFEEGRELFDDFWAEFLQEEITVLTGSSGCGKSTLLYLTAGIYPHNAGKIVSGSIKVNGIVPDSLPSESRCSLVGMMFQNAELQFCMDTVKRELAFCLENICAEPQKMEAQIEEALAFCGITHLKERKLLTLSGGERQKVMLACTVLLKPQWLLLDEPFANVDDEAAKEIAAKLRELHNQYGTGILAVDHRLENWLGVVDTIRMMEKGKLFPQKISPQMLDAEKLEAAGVIVPHTSYGVYEKKSLQEFPTALELKNVSLYYGKRQIINQANACFQQGGIYAIIGESGCGKSSLFGAMIGLCRYKGEILVEGSNVKKFSWGKKSKIGFVTQNPQDQFVGRTVLDEILCGLKGNPDALTEAEKILKDIRLWPYRELSPYLLSQGQQRRLGVAALLAYHCQVLICDEPTYAQDRNNTIAIMQSLCRQAREHKLTLLFSTHDRQLAFDFADEVWQLKGGMLHAVTESGI